jgi:ferric-chelate reductase
LTQLLTFSRALIDGPYGSSHNDFAAFDTVLLVAGSTGTTFTLSILLDIAARIQKIRLPVKRIVFLWVVKATFWTSWISSELTSAAAALCAAGIELSIQVHVTCDDTFTTGEEDQSSPECGCECDKSLGPCCCVLVNADDGNDTIRDIIDEKGQPVNSKEAQINVKSRSQSSSIKSGKKSGVLPCAEFYSGRPDFYKLLWSLLENAEGETGVAVCGPLGLSSDVRRTVVRCSDERAVHKGTGAQGVYLHAECFGW